MFDYTEFTHTASSVIDRVSYNHNTRECGIEIDGNVYVYDGVPHAAYLSLTTALSVGREFANFKGLYGPSVRVTTWGNYLSKRPVGTPKGLKLAEDVVDRTMAQVYSLKPAGDDATDDIGEVYEEYSSRGAESTAYSVRFKVVGTDTVRVFNVAAEDAEHAIENLHAATDALDLDVAIVEVCLG